MKLLTIVLAQGRNIPTHDRDVLLLGVAGAALLVAGGALLLFVRRRSK